ncbi:unnamed protein product [Brassicogethes aeneus]|uniref:Uncharacterized protein n=1 Tax=Brassicogethes aeneus TaxID=1431903 RepID=A0A9P0AW87_BRAAE|nr:unnamed protein product [Brassicogethes aeneus]
MGPVSGFIYEQRLFSLLALRCALDTNIKNFKIGSNLKNFGSLDDIIMEVEYNDGEQKMFLCQLKYHTGSKNLSLNLNKYIRDYNCIQKNYENVKINVIIHTSAKKDCISQHKALIEMDNFNSNLKIFETNKNGYIHKYTTKGLNINDKSITANMVDNFINNCFVFSSQNNIDELLRIVNEEFKKNVKVEQFQLILNYFDTVYLKRNEFISKEEIEWMLKVKILYPFVDHVLQNVYVNDNNCVENDNVIIETLNLFHVSTLSNESMSTILRIITIILETRFDINNLKKELWLEILPENLKIDEEPYFQTLKYIKNNELLSYKDLLILLWMNKDIPLPLIYTEENKRQINFVLENFSNNFSVVLLNKTEFNVSLENFNIFTNFNDIHNKDLKEKNLDLVRIKLHPEESITLKELNFADGITSDIYVKLCSGAENDFKLSNKLPFYITRTLKPLVFNENIFMNDDFLFVVHGDEKKDHHQIQLEDIFKKIVEKLEFKDLTFRMPSLSSIQSEHPKKISKLSDFLKEYSKDGKIKNTTVYSKSSLWKTQNKLKKTFQGSYCCLVEFHEHFLCYAYNGSIEKLSDFMVNMSIDERELLELGLPINIIYGNAGIGKSFMLRNVENILSKEYWVVNLTNNNIFDDTILSDKNMFINYLLIHQVGEKVFNAFKQFLIKLFINRIKNKKVCITIDAFDEMNLGSKVLETISNLLQVPVIISTRPTMKNNLENELCVPSFKINKFSRKNQIDFLQQSASLSPEYKNGVINELKIENSFFGVPLLLKLLVEILPDVNEIKNMNLIVLYEKYLTKSIKHYRNADRRTIKSLAFRLFFKKHFSNFLNETLFKEDVEDFQRTIKETKNNIIGGLYNENEPIFVHRTFAEFLCAQYLTEICMENKFQNIFEELFKERKLNQIKYFFDLITCQDLPLHFAALRNDCKKLAQMHNLFEKDMLGRTVLHIIATYGCYDDVIFNPNNHLMEISCKNKINPFVEANNIIDTILKKSDVKDIIALKDKFNNNVINCILLSESLDILNKICTYTEINLNKVNRDDFLLKIISFDYHTIFELLINEPKIRTNILGSNLNVNGRIINPLHKSLKIAELLIINGINIGEQNMYGVTALIIAAVNNDTDAIKLLVLQGADVNAQDAKNKNSTPLHFVTHHGNLESAKVLLSKGANINAQQNNGDSPLMIAAYTDHRKTWKLVNKKAQKNFQKPRGYSTLYFVAYKDKGNNKIAEVIPSKGEDAQKNDDDLILTSKNDETDI